MNKNLVFRAPLGYSLSNHTAGYDNFLTRVMFWLVNGTGLGSGKTHASVCQTIAIELKYPVQNVAYYLTTYNLMAIPFFPRFAKFSTI